MDETAQRTELAKEARRISEDATHSGASHFVEGQTWRAWAFWLGLPATIGLAITSAGAGLSVLLGGDAWLSAVLAFVVAIAVAVRDYVAADAKATAHSTKGAHYFSLRDDARRFANVEALGPRSLDALTASLAALAARQKRLRDEEPREVSTRSREKARAGIEAGDYRHEVDS